MLSALVAETAVLCWLAVAFVAAVIEVSVPHFGSAFVSAGAVELMALLKRLLMLEAS